MSLLSQKQDLEEKYKDFDRKRSESQGMLKSYISKLKELGITNPKIAKEKLLVLEKSNKELEKQLEVLVNNMESKLQDVSDDF